MLTSLPAVVIALYGLYEIRRQRLPSRVALSPIGLLAVALGSAAFHASLVKGAQLMDELPMCAIGSWQGSSDRLNCTALCSLLVVTARPPSVKPSLQARLAPWAILSIAVVANVVYLVSDEFIFFAIAFAVSLVSGALLGS